VQDAKEVTAVGGSKQRPLKEIKVNTAKHAKKGEESEVSFD